LLALLFAVGAIVLQMAEVIKSGLMLTYVKTKLFFACFAPGSLFVTGLLVCLTLYLTWSSVGEHMIDGVQPRYFFPMLIAIPLLIGSLLPGKQYVVPAVIHYQGRVRIGLYALLMFLLLSCFVQLVFDLVLRWW
jgi:uncharacterized membrane protein